MDGSNSDSNPLEQAQQQIEALTSQLQRETAEKGSLQASVTQLRRELEEEQEKNKKLEQTMKEKDAKVRGRGCEYRDSVGRKL